MVTELRDWWDAPAFADEPEDVQDVLDFLTKMDSEGGPDGMLGWGGVDAFPEPLRRTAAMFEMSLKQLEHEITAWAAQRGVRA